MSSTGSVGVNTVYIEGRGLQKRGVLRVIEEEYVPVYASPDSQEVLRLWAHVEI